LATSTPAFESSRRSSSALLRNDTEAAGWLNVNAIAIFGEVENSLVCTEYCQYFLLELPLMTH